MRSRISFALAAAVVIVFQATLWAGEAPKPKETALQGVHSLAEFGDISTDKAALAALEKGLAAIVAEGGGILVVPPEAPKHFKVENTIQWKRDSGPTVTVIDLRKGYMELHVPSVGNHCSAGWAGTRTVRTLNLGQRSLPHCGTHEVQGINNYIVSGATSYMMTTLLSCKAGKDQRIYVESVRGLWVGAWLNLTGKPMSYAQPYDRITIKKIGWDADKRRWYIVADLEHDHPAGVLLYNKHVTGSLDIKTFSQCDNQTASELSVSRHTNADGDNFLITGIMYYQSNIFSGFGDEGAVLLNAEVVQDVDAFHSTVEAYDPADDRITYAAGNVNAHKVATSRGLINMNKKKWITQGKVVIVPPDNWGGYFVNDPSLVVDKHAVDLARFQAALKKVGDGKSPVLNYDGTEVVKFKYTYKGRAYPSMLHGSFNYLGGVIKGSSDCGWTPAVVGRWFAVADPSEMIMPGERTTVGGYANRARRPVYRWYVIRDFMKHPDGTCDIRIERIRWYAGAAGAPNLFRDDNYTWDGHERPLDYIITPGAYVYDVSQGWVDSIATGGWVGKNAPRNIRVTPNGDRGTPFDFAPGDPIEQAVGADPYRPRPFRIRTFDEFPSVIENSMIELNQLGRVATEHAISISGITRRLEDLERRKDGKPSILDAIALNSLAENGLAFNCDVTNAAILMRQPNRRAQPIKWQFDRGRGTASLIVDPDDGTFRIAGGQVSTEGSGVVNAGGLSATAQPARNLRGIDVEIKAGARQAFVKFPAAEADAKYSISLTPSWLTTLAVTKKQADGFILQFGTPVPQGGRIDWQLVR